MSLKLVAIGLVAGLFSALFGVGGGIVIVPLLILLLGLRRQGRHRHLAGGDRDHRARRHDPLRVRGPRRRRVRRARRPPGRRGCDHGHRDPAAHLGTRALARLRRPAHSPRRLAPRRMSATTVVARDPARLRRREPGRLLRRRRRDPVRADARRARPLPARRGGDVAARDPADGRRGHLAAAALRQRQLAHRARARPRLDRSAPPPESRSRPRSRRTCCGGSSRCCCSASPRNSHGGRVAMPRILLNHDGA